MFGSFFLDCIVRLFFYIASLVLEMVWGTSLSIVMLFAMMGDVILKILL
jgi:hypothetical protein